MSQENQESGYRKPESIVGGLKEILKDFELREMRGRKEFLGIGMQEYPEVSKALSGMRRGGLHLVAGASTSGRLQVLMEWTVSMIRTHKVPVMFLTFSTPPRELLYQVLSRESGLDMETVLHRKIVGDAGRKEKLKQALDRLSKYQSYLHLMGGSMHDHPGSIEMMVWQLREQLKSKEMVLVVDSLQGIPATDSFGGIGASVRALKGIALSLDIPVIVGCEVNSEGRQIDANEGRDHLELKHIQGDENLATACDAGMVICNNPIDTRELREQLKKIALQLGKDDQRLPPFEIFDLYFERQPHGSIRNSPPVQLMISRENGKVIELGPWMEQDIHRFNRIEKSLANLAELGEIAFREFDPTAASAPAQAEAAMPGVPSQGTAVASQPRPKVKIALRK